MFLEDIQAEPGSIHPVGQVSPASILTYEPNHIIVEVDLESPGYLVLADPWYPGWITHAWMAGQPGSFEPITCSVPWRSPPAGTS